MDIYIGLFLSFLTHTRNIYLCIQWCFLSFFVYLKVNTTVGRDFKHRTVLLSCMRMNVGYLEWNISTFSF